MIPVKDYTDWDYSSPRTLTCANHTDLRWYWRPQPALLTVRPSRTHDRRMVARM